MNLRDRLEAIEADITTLSVDAIVNAANAALHPGGGVDGAIRKRAGPDLDEDLSKIRALAPGSAVITSGYLLPAKFVIHTAAPVWAGPAKAQDQNKLFTGCYESVLKLADDNDVQSLAIPAIGTGAYRWPADLAARLAFKAVASHLRNCEMHTMVTFSCFSRVERERYADLIAGLRD
jgi:O-acetyl-ADP-ribose deacetylase (regulator of RNase III)